ncbi:rod shape-determining protein [Halopseudomonas sp.]|uniref:rod shape-determining protein n=1 Tax=Halopseudomonas sp. TaxID=2901191 RepID=UPI0030028BBB
MLKSLQSKLAPTLYVQLGSREIRITNVATAKVLSEPTLMALETDAKGVKQVLAVGREASALPLGAGRILVNPFDHPRMLVADFALAEKCLQLMLKKVAGKGLLSASPKVIMHPMEKLEGGLTQVGHRVMRELALGAGAHAVCVYTGAPLVAQQLDFAALKRAEAEMLGLAMPTRRGGLSSGAVMLLSLAAMGLLLWLRSQS